MPVTPTSRYYGATVFDATDTEGTPHPTIAMRLVPPPDIASSAYQHVVSGMETLEYIAWRYLHTSAGWWRIADANPLIFPLDWRPGMSLALPPVSERGRIERTRRF